MPDIRRGRRLALDWGKARIGVAASDPDGILAFPVETIPTGDAAPARIAALAAEYEPLEVILGLPVDLRGDEGLAASMMREVASKLAGALAPVPVRLVDERLSSVAGHRNLAAAGKDSRKRRAVIDQAAAVAILEQALEIERRTGNPPGELTPAFPEAPASPEQ